MLAVARIENAVADGVNKSIGLFGVEVFALGVIANRVAEIVDEGPTPCKFLRLEMFSREIGVPFFGVGIKRPGDGIDHGAKAGAISAIFSGRAGPNQRLGENGAETWTGR